MSPPKVDPTSDLAGYTYERSDGRYVTFFWQGVSDDYSGEHSLNQRSASYIYHSTFRKTDPGWALVSGPILVAVDAKKQSPFAAVTWSNGLKGAVYYLNESNIICEQITTDHGESWHGGSLTRWAVPTRSHSSLSAIVTWESLRCMEIYVYFQDQRNHIRELRFGSEKGEWHEDRPTGIELLKGLSGTSITCATGSSWRCVVSQSAAGDVQELLYSADENNWTSDDPLQSKVNGRKARLGYCVDELHFRIYVHDGSKALERVGKAEWDWNDQVVLPMSTGTAKIKDNFVVLL